MEIPKKSFMEAMNAKTIGSGETLVLAHGFGGDQSLWDKIVPHFTSKYKVVIFDWSFVGTVNDQSLFDPIKYSTYDGFADDLISLLDEMKLTSTVFVGHSLSAMIGFFASFKRPDLFKKFIAIGGSPRYLDLEEYEGGLSPLACDQYLSGIETDYNTWVDSRAIALVDGKDQLSREKYRKTLLSMNPDAAYVVAKLFLTGDYRHILEKVTIPCTIINVSNDPATPMVVAYYMQKNIKAESNVEIVNGIGHFPHLTEHIQLVEILGRTLGCDVVSA